MNLTAVLLPWVLACVIAASPQRGVIALAPLASLPALALALLPEQAVGLDWVLLGIGLGADSTSRAFLLLLGSAWTLAGWFALGRVTTDPRSFWVFWLLTLTGINLVFLARDAAGFYCGYAIMTLAGYGLVIHERSGSALRAGRVYLVLGLIGEALIITGLFLLAARFGNIAFARLPEALGSGSSPAALFLFAGFAVKMGVLPLHVWLPLAHPVAPVPASAILSGVIVKAGLLGWLRFLPPEIFATPPPTLLLVTLGLIGAFYAALMALTQERPKTILAWSTVSQLGLLLALFAATLRSPLAREVMVPVLGLWVLHHGLNKAALFLAVGSAPLAGRWRMLLLALPALSISGLPLTSGGLAKDAAKAGFATLELPHWITTAFTLSSITTSLVLLHLYRRLARVEHQAAPTHPAWVLLTLLGLLLPWWWARAHALGGLPDLAGLWSGLWPIAAAVALALAWWRYGPLQNLRLPEDEMLALWRWLHARLPASSAATSLVQRPAFLFRIPTATLAAGVHRLESRLTALPVVGGVLIALTLLLWSSLAG